MPSSTPHSALLFRLSVVGAYRPGALLKTGGLLMLLGLSLYGQAAENCQRNSIRNVHFIDNLDGTITDTSSRLMWKKCSEGQEGEHCEEGRVKAFNWLGAMRVPDQINSTGGFADFNDWRLPTTLELKTLLDPHCQHPALDLDAFPTTPAQSWYWGTSPVSGYEDEGTLISADFSGNLNATGNTSGQLRLVRDAR